MQQAILIINLGSSSLKFSIFSVDDSHHLNTHPIITGQFAPLEATTQLKIRDESNNIIKKTIKLPEKDHSAIQAAVFVCLLEWLAPHLSNYKIVGAGHRVVHGGNLFTRPVIINPEILNQLQAFSAIAPLHQPYNLLGIQLLAKQLPSIKQVACFDTAFHSTQSDIAQTYAIPTSLSDHFIKRYGFHGLSYEYIAQVLPHYLDSKLAEGKIIVAHLGHGASLCAMCKRKSIATTMGFTALDGLPMGTRCGNIDPGIILYLMTEKSMSVSEITDILYNKSGLLGVSGISDDIRELIKSEDSNAKRAINVFVYRIIREIGSLMAALGGMEGIVFTGGIGEHCAIIRTEICKQLSWLGIVLDFAANAANEIIISLKESTIPILVIPTHEELVIAKQTWACIG